MIWRIDLGTPNTVVVVPGRGIVLNELTDRAVKAHTNIVLAAEKAC